MHLFKVLVGVLAWLFAVSYSLSAGVQESAAKPKRPDSKAQCALEVAGQLSNGDWILKIVNSDPDAPPLPSSPQVPAPPAPGPGLSKEAYEKALEAHQAKLAEIAKEPKNQGKILTAGSNPADLALAHNHCIRVTGNKAGLIEGWAPFREVAALGELPSNVSTALAPGTRIGEALANSLVDKISAHYKAASEKFYKKIEEKGPFPPLFAKPNPVDYVISNDLYRVGLQNRVAKENAQIGGTKRALTEFDRGMVTNKVKTANGLDLYLELGEIEKSPAGEKKRANRDMGGAQRPKSEGITMNMRTPDNEVISVSARYLEAGESLIVSKGRARIEQFDATLIPGQDMIQYSGKARIVREAEFPEFTEEVIAKSEVGRIITQKKTLQRLRDFICAEGEFAHLATPPSAGSK